MQIPNAPGEPDSNGDVGGACGDAEEAGIQEQGQGQAPGNAVAENQEHSEVRVAPLTDGVEEAMALDASDTGGNDSSIGETSFEGIELPPLGADGLLGVSADDADQEDPTEIETRGNADFQHDRPSAVADDDLGTTTRVSARYWPLPKAKLL